MATFNGSNGAGPGTATLIADASGNLYGTTRGDDGAGGGIAFKLSANNQYALSTLATFTGSNGFGPNAGMIADASGNLYGTTQYGGASGLGSVYKLDASNNYAISTLASFTGTNGTTPYLGAGLYRDGSGNLYGTTNTGGSGSGAAGTVFKLDASNNYALSTLVTFNGPNGGLPQAGLIGDASGNLYGTTASYGPGPSGTVFKLDASNNYALSTLVAFDTTNGPGGPATGLVADSAGNLYGTTSTGAFGSTVFKLDASANYSLTTLAGFNNDHPYGGGLILDSDGNLYGMTSYGGANDDGKIYKLDKSNNYAMTTLASFDASTTGRFPYSANLLADSAGNLYGTTDEGGPGNFNFGTVFVLSDSGFAVVPEPSSLGVLGFAGIAFTSRRRSRAK